MTTRIGRALSAGLRLLATLRRAEDGECAWEREDGASGDGDDGANKIAFYMLWTVPVPYLVPQGERDDPPALGRLEETVTSRHCMFSGERVTVEIPHETGMDMG